jgi:hypothetical protein
MLKGHFSVPAGASIAVMLKSMRIVPVPHPFGGAFWTIHAVIASESGATGSLDASWYQIASGGKNRPSACDAHSVLSSPAPVVPDGSVVPSLVEPVVASVVGPAVVGSFDVGPAVVGSFDVGPAVVGSLVVGPPVEDVSEDMVVGPGSVWLGLVEPVPSVSVVPPPPPPHATARVATAAHITR